MTSLFLSIARHMVDLRYPVDFCMVEISLFAHIVVMHSNLVPQIQISQLKDKVVVGLIPDPMG